MNEMNALKLRILVIEDNPADVELLKMALRHAELDCEMTVVDDGAEALALVGRPHSFEDSTRLDLAIIDLNLPKYGGEEILQALRANPTLSHLPVAVLSSSSAPRDRRGLQSLRVGRYIVKPADLDEFLQIGITVREFLQESRPPAS